MSIESEAKASLRFTETPAQPVQDLISIPEGTLQALKWLALVAMAFDHSNKYAFRDQVQWVFDIGRSVLPIFAFVLAYNLARSGALGGGAGRRTLLRLIGAGLISLPIVYVLNAPLVTKWPWWPLNVLFMFALAIGSPLLWRSGGFIARALAVLLFVLGGAFVEYFWFGIMVCWASYVFCRRPTGVTFGLWTLSLLSLTVVNGNFWALAAMPILLLATKVRLVIPRTKWTFYAFYPAHLVLIWIALCGLGVYHLP